MFSKRRTEKDARSLGSGLLLARWYDRTHRRDMSHVLRHARRIAGLVRPQAKVLEVGPGPGYLSIELARRGLNVTAVETSQRWIDIARQNAAGAGVEVQFRLSDPAVLPIASGSVDFVVCRAAFKSFAQPVKAMQEMLRVLRPGGMVLLIDLRSDLHLNVVRNYLDGLGIGWPKSWFMLLVFRKVLSKQAYSIAEIEQMAYEAGWVNPKIRRCVMGFEAWVKK